MDREAERFDQLAQRVGAKLRLVVELGDARVVSDGSPAELPGEDLAAQPSAGLEQGDRVVMRGSLLEQVSRQARPR